MFIIAEVAQAHEGSLGIAHSYIDALAQTGVDAIKFQTHIASAESSEYEQFRVNFSYEDKTRYDYWKRMEFTQEQWAGLKKHCEEKNVEFISSPFSVEAVNLLENLEVKKYKVGSGEISNFLILDKIAQTKKPIIISSGMSSWAELEETIDFIKPYGNPISLMQCTTEYPARPENWGLNIIGKMKDRFRLPIGFSDHSSRLEACLAATALGAELIEFHAVFHKQIFGPDAKASLTIDEVTELVKGIRNISCSLQNNYDKVETKELVNLKKIFGKSLSISKDLEIGHQLSIDDLESKKPADRGIPAKLYATVIGKKLIRPKRRNEFLNIEDLEDLS
jgi:N-acetylneuraminate synthase